MIERYMKSLNISQQEAIALAEYDKTVDRMSVKEAQSDLTDEQKKAVKKYTITGEKKPTIYKLESRQRKADNVKREIVKLIAETLTKYESVSIENPERLITFQVNGEKYEVTLVKKRGDKK